MELCDFTASELSVLLRKREISSKEITESVFERIDEKEQQINAYITLIRDKAIKRAEFVDKKFSKNSKISPLNGIPIAIKDNLCTEGITTTCGSKILENFVPTYDATAGKKVFQDGSVLIGKTNLDEFGMGSSTETGAFGPTRNPLNIDYVAGGSSGGSAAAVACGEAILALGRIYGRIDSNARSVLWRCWH